MDSVYHEALWMEEPHLLKLHERAGRCPCSVVYAAEVEKCCNVEVEKDLVLELYGEALERAQVAL